MRSSTHELGDLPHLLEAERVGSLHPRDDPGLTVVGVECGQTLGVAGTMLIARARGVT